MSKARTAACVKFGWLAEHCVYSEDRFHIKPIPEIDQAIAGVANSGRIKEDWFYPLLLPKEPIRPAPWYKLPCTHTLHVAGKQRDHCGLSILLVLVFGFLKGLRLIPEPWVHFYRVPTKLQQLQDFYVEERAVTRVLNRAYDFRMSNKAEVQRLMIGALHWHSFGRSYEHAFEVFNAQYTVLDACWKIHCELTGKKPRCSHARRVEVLASEYGIQVPEWASTTNGESFLSQLRNALIHEGLWAQEPIGFTHPPLYKAIHIDLYHLNSRILLALLGDSTEYIRKPLGRSMTLLR